MIQVFEKCESCGNLTNEPAKSISVPLEKVICYGCARECPAPRFPLYSPNAAMQKDIDRHRETLDQALTRRAKELSEAFKDFSRAEAKLAVADNAYKTCLERRNQLL